MSEIGNERMRLNFTRKSTSELRNILAERDSGDWSEEAIRAAEELLAQRPPEAPENHVASGVKKTKKFAPTLFRPTQDDIIGYRMKIQFYGWIICVKGVLFALTISAPMFFGQPHPTKLLFPALGGLIGYYVISVGRGLIRLNPSARTPGIVIASLTLLAFPIGTVIALLGIFWIGKHGYVMSMKMPENNDD